MHDVMKAKFLTENQDEKWKTDFIEMISVPGHKFFPQMNQRRFIKTHLPFKLLPPTIMETKAKVVYVARHPKDVVVSYYHLNKLYRTQGFQNDFNTFFEYFMKDLCELKYIFFLSYYPRSESHVRIEISTVFPFFFFFFFISTLEPVF